MEGREAEGMEESGNKKERGRRNEEKEEGMEWNNLCFGEQKLFSIHQQTFYFLIRFFQSY